MTERRNGAPLELYSVQLCYTRSYTRLFSGGWGAPQKPQNIQPSFLSCGVVVLGRLPSPIPPIPCCLPPMSKAITKAGWAVTESQRSSKRQSFRDLCLCLFTGQDLETSTRSEQEGAQVSLETGSAL